MQFRLSCVVRSGLVALAGLLALTAQSPTTAPAAQDPAAEQDPLIAAKTKLIAALQKTASLTDTRFQASWGPEKKDNQPADPFQQMIRGGSSSLTGSWHRDCLRAAFDGDQGDELLLVGRRMIAKDSDHGWAARTGRFADGNQIRFLPDVPTLLQRLSTWDLTVTRRSVSSIDDRPVEIVSVTLDAEQAAEAIWSGLVPDSTTMLGSFFGVLAGNKRRPVPAKVDCKMDLAIAFDPSTGIVQELRSRRWEPLQARVGGRQIFVAGAGAGVTVTAQNGGDNADDEDDETKAGAKDAPLQYENGLPLRPRKKQLVTDFTLRLFDHGKVPPPELTAEQKRLLGL